MIFCKNKIGKVLIDDVFNVNATSKINIDIVKILIKDLEGKIAPENGSPTYMLVEELKKFGFEILDVELPIIEQLENIVY